MRPGSGNPQRPIAAASGLLHTMEVIDLSHFTAVAGAAETAQHGTYALIVETAGRLV
ncbi:MAG TPA: hypothetical protein VMP01_28865 [Pirellulaceae bacterium]|nr:hypothetical protein [Pirellulaceae bacterium]